MRQGKQCHWQKRGRHCISCKMFCHKQARQTLSALVLAVFTASKRFTLLTGFFTASWIPLPWCNSTRRCGTLPMYACQRKQRLAHPARPSVCRVLKCYWANKSDIRWAILNHRITFPFRCYDAVRFKNRREERKKTLWCSFLSSFNEEVLSSKTAVIAASRLWFNNHATASCFMLST